MEKDDQDTETSLDWFSQVLNALVGNVESEDEATNESTKPHQPALQ